jgi:quinolinate synthase
MKKKEVLARIEHAKKRLGKDVIILAHFYQNDDIVRFADFVGDSLQLADQASKQRHTPYIIFCAVSFMAEMARILCRPEQEVFHPEPRARCPLADMTGIEQAEAAWTELKGFDKKIIPVVYINSTADLKAFCGRNGGIVCTSSNAKQVFQYVFSQDASVFFFPDENLGRNTSHSLDMKDDKIFLWDPERGTKGVYQDLVEKTKILLWKGYCYVHMEFLPSDVLEVRNKAKGIAVIVHPECTSDVVALSDFVGSTSFIKNTVERSASGSKWAIGTEWNFAQRMKKQNPDKFIVPLRKSGCNEMANITPQKLLQVLEGLMKGNPFGQVTVDDGIIEDARRALQRMLEIA